jgi:hypothetical protein
MTVHAIRDATQSAANEPDLILEATTEFVVPGALRVEESLWCSLLRYNRSLPIS